MRLSAEMYKGYKKYPEKVVQFGEGNFLRAFVDWIIDSMNSRGVFNGSAVVVQPIGHGMVDKLNEQDGLYTLFLQGIENGKAKKTHKIINSISRGISPYSDYNGFMKLAESDDLRFVISNTTEAGIAFEPEDKLSDTPEKSYPGKLTAFLYHRFVHFKGRSDKGLIIIPCELIDRNGDKLKEIILKYTNLWNLGEEFENWLQKDNVFCCSLVDRIVPGYPRDNIKEIQEQLGYEDQLVDVGERFHLWVIEGPKWIEKEFPAGSIGLNVKFVDDLTPYRERKVRILNGSHTTMVPVAYLYGIDTVGDAMADDVISSYVYHAAYDEIIPTLNLPEDELKAFAADVFDRFKNPYVKHMLMSIALNSMSKYETRVLPSLLEYKKRTGKLPKRLVFSLAAYIEFYKGRRGNENIALNDDPEILECYKNVWKDFDGSLRAVNNIVTKVLGLKVWNMDLNSVEGLNKMVTDYLYDIETRDFKEVVKEMK